MPKKVISVISGKGGVGKSAVSVNLAVSLSTAGASTVLIDADIYNPCVFFHLGLSPQAAGLKELLDGEAKLEEVLPIHPNSGLRCIMSSIHTYGDIKASHIPDVIRELNYEYIIIDCPPGFSPTIEKSIEASTHVYILMTPDLPSCSAALKLYTFAKNNVKNANLHFSFFLNRVSNTAYEVHPREVEALFKEKLSALVPEDPNVPRSIASKTPLVSMNSRSPFSRTIFQMSKTLLRDRDRSFDFMKRAKPMQPKKTGAAEAAEPAPRQSIVDWVRGIFRAVFRR